MSGSYHARGCGRPSDLDSLNRSECGISVKESLSPVSTKDTTENTLESQHFPVLHPNSGRVCPLLWDSIIPRKLKKKKKSEGPPVFRALDFLRLWTSDFFSFVLKVQWTCCCSMDIYICAIQVIIIIIIIIIIIPCHTSSYSCKQRWIRHKNAKIKTVSENSQTPHTTHKELTHEDWIH